MTTSLARRIAALLWVIILFGALATYLFRNSSAFLSSIDVTSPLQLFLSFVLVLVGKYLLAATFGAVAARHGVELSALDRQRIYHESQLAKYLPGTVWQFAAKGVRLKGAGATPKNAAAIIAVEQFWIVGGAAVIGFTLAVIARALGFRYGVLSRLIPESGWVVTGIAFALLAMLVVLVPVGLGRRRGLPDLSETVLIFGAWSVLSASFAVLGFGTIAARGDFVTFIGLAAGFMLAYVGGYLAPFAPGGIGVREGLVVVLFAPMVGLDAGVAIGLIARAVYVSAEIALVVAILASLQLRRRLKVNK